MHTGNLWPIVTVIGVILLGAAIAYGMIRNSRRDKRMDAVTEAATRDQYDPDRTSYRPDPDANNTSSGPRT